MHRAEKATTARFIGQSKTAGPQCKTPFMSALWDLEFGGGSYIFGRISSLLLKAQNQIPTQLHTDVSLNQHRDKSKVTVVVQIYVKLW